MAKEITFQEADAQILAQREQELMHAQQRQMPLSLGMFDTVQKPNLVEWQLDFRSELEDIERLLKCDIVVRDEKSGKEYWAPNPSEEHIVFNSLGVNDILREIRMFLNKNKVLSNYKPEEINPRVRMLGHELRALVFNNYEKYGMNNEYKMNNYSIMILTILSMIEDSYRRATNGEERRDLNQARIVQQNEAMMPQQSFGYPVQPQSKKGLRSLMPWNWGR